MACRIFGAKPLSKPMLCYWKLDAQEQATVKLQSKYKTPIHENASDSIVCKMVTILSR